MSGVWAASYVALWAVVGLLSFVSLGLLRQLGLIQMRIGLDQGALITKEGLERGTPAPDFEAIDVVSGETVRLSQYRGRRTVIVFLTTGCLACRELVPHLNQVARDEQGRITFLTVCYGDLPSCLFFTKTYKLETRMLADPTNAIAESYQIDVTPFTFLIDENGVVLFRGIANNWPQLEALLREEGTLQTRQFVDVDGGHHSTPTGKEVAAKASDRMVLESRVDYQAARVLTGQSGENNGRQ